MLKRSVEVVLGHGAECARIRVAHGGQWADTYVYDFRLEGAPSCHRHTHATVKIIAVRTVR